MQKQENKTLAISLIVLIVVLCAYFIFNIIAGINIIKKKNNATIIESQTTEKYLLTQLMNDPVKGIKSVPVTMYIFSNFESNKTKDVLSILNNILVKYPDKVNIVWKDFWTSKDYLAPGVALAARCANEQGKYWEFAEKLLNNSNNFNLTQYKQIASELKIDENKFLLCYQSGKYVQDVQYNIVEADVLKLDTIPTVFINQQKISGNITQDNLENIIKALIK